MSILDTAWNWNATAEERRAAYPCDKYVHGPHRVLMRAIDIGAPTDLVYRWVCQLRVAPYSYDLLDNLGRHSPRRLTPGVEHLALGQRFLVGFRIVEFEAGRHVTAVAEAGLLCGRIGMTYALVPAAAGARLVVKFGIESRSRWDLLRLVPLAWGDLIMMRKQFLTLKELAERDAHASGTLAVAAADV
jgi:hypothetical protein